MPLGVGVAPQTRVGRSEEPFIRQKYIWAPSGEYNPYSAAMRAVSTISLLFILCMYTVKISVYPLILCGEFSIF